MIAINLWCGHRLIVKIRTAWLGQFNFFLILNCLSLKLLMLLMPDIADWKLIHSKAEHRTFWPTCRVVPIQLQPVVIAAAGASRCR